MLRKASPILLYAALLSWSASSLAQERFKTPEAAVDALVAAAKSGDVKAILAVLGPSGRAIVSSGDPVADRNTKEKFISAYDAKHAIEMEGDGTRTLIAGDDDWPFPIPLVNKGGQWQFNTEAGLDEILRRRIGRNELSVIQVSLAYVQAQNEYASLDPGGLGRHVYAQRIVSRPGKKDGLPPRVRPQARSANWLRKLLRKAIRLEALRYRITAITTAFSSAKAPARQGVRTTISSMAR